MQRIADAVLQPATAQAMVGLQMADDRLHGLTTLEPETLRPGQRLVAPTMDDLDDQVVGIHPAIAEVRRDLAGFSTHAFEHNGGLL